MEQPEPDSGQDPPTIITAETPVTLPTLTARLAALEHALSTAESQEAELSTHIEQVSHLVDTCETRQGKWDERMRVMVETDTRRSFDAARKQEQLVAAFGIRAAKPAPVFRRVLAHVVVLFSVVISFILVTPLSMLRRWRRSYSHGCTLKAPRGTTSRSPSEGDNKKCKEDREAPRSGEHVSRKAWSTAAQFADEKHNTICATALPRQRAETSTQRVDLRPSSHVANGGINSSALNVRRRERGLACSGVSVCLGGDLDTAPVNNFSQDPALSVSTNTRRTSHGAADRAHWIPNLGESGSTSNIIEQSLSDNIAQVPPENIAILRDAKSHGDEEFGRSEPLPQGLSVEQTIPASSPVTKPLEAFKSPAFPSIVEADKSTGSRPGSGLLCRQPSWAASDIDVVKADALVHETSNDFWEQFE